MIIKLWTLLAAVQFPYVIFLRFFLWSKNILFHSALCWKYLLLNLPTCSYTVRSKGGNTHSIQLNHLPLIKIKLSHLNQKNRREIKKLTMTKLIDSQKVKYEEKNSIRPLICTSYKLITEPLNIYWISLLKAAIRNVVTAMHDATLFLCI